MKVLTSLYNKSSAKKADKKAELDAEYDTEIARYKNEKWEVEMKIVSLYQPYHDELEVQTKASRDVLGITRTQ